MVPLDVEVVEEAFRHEAALQMPQEALFDRKCAKAVLARVLRILEQEYRELDQVARFEAMKPLLGLGADGAMLSEKAESLGMAPGAFRTALHRFRGRYRELFRAEVAESRQPTASKLGRHVDRDLAIICAKCLENPEQRRYATALELAEDLDRYLRGEPIRARAITWVEQAWHWCRMRPVTTMLVTFLLLALGIGTASSPGAGSRTVGTSSPRPSSIPTRGLPCWRTS